MEQKVFTEVDPSVLPHLDLNGEEKGTLVVMGETNRAHRGILLCMIVLHL